MPAEYQATSRAAWREHDCAPVNAAILDVLEAMGEATCDDIEVLTGFDHQTVSANISHLKNGTQGTPRWIEATGEKAKTRAGRFASVLRLLTEPAAPVTRSPREPATYAVKTRLTGLRRNILTHLTANPSTCDEIEIALGTSHQTTSARLRELRRAGFIHDSLLTRKTRSGKKAIVWEQTHG